MKRCSRYKKAKAEAEAAVIAVGLVFPIEIMYDILSRLCMQELSPCRFVCKAWHQIIVKDSLFGELHHSRLVQPGHRPPSFLIIPRIHVPHPNSLFSIDITTSSNNDDKFVLNWNAKPILFSSQPFLFKESPTIVGSSAGLLCLQSPSDYRSHYILNPLTNPDDTMVRLPRAPPMDPPDKGSQLEFDSQYEDLNIIPPAGFGFDSVTKTYSLIQAWSFPLCSHPPRAVFNMYTLGSPNWTRFHELPATFSNDQNSPAFVHNALHWKMFAPPHRHHIIGALHLPAATFTTLKFPAQYNFYNYACLCSLNESLSLCYEIAADIVGLWVMKDYGVDSSWTFAFRFLLQNVVPPLPAAPLSRHWMKSFHGYRTVTTLNDDGTRLIVADSNYIIYCDFENKEYQLLDIPGLSRARNKSCQTAPVAHIGTLISPKAIAAAAGINLQLIRKKRKRTSRR